MNYTYPIPGAVTSNPNAFVADNTNFLGDVDKTAEGRVKVVVDYSQLTPPVELAGYSFRVHPGGEPQLWLDQSGIIAILPSLTFYVKGGIPGRQYAVTIDCVLATGEIRSDVLNVNVMLGGACGATMTLPHPPTFGAVSGDGTIVYNDVPRFFVSATPPVSANVLDRWYNTSTGVVSDYITNGRSNAWVASAGGGGGVVTGGVNLKKMKSIAPDGATTAFTLVATDLSPVNVLDTLDLFVSVDGVWQEPITHYSAAGAIVTFTQAPSADAAVFMLWFAPG